MNKREKVCFSAVAVLAAVLLLLLLLGSCDDCDDGTPTTAPKVTVTATVTATPSPAGSQIGKSVDGALERMKQTGLSVVVHDASDQDETPGADWTVCFEKATLTKVDFAAVPHGAPCPKKDGQRVPWPKMPKVIGVTYAEAVERLEGDAGRVEIEAAYADEAAYDADNESGSYANWKVCFQSVKAGASLEDKPHVTLHAVENGDGCPSSKGLYKEPTNDPLYVAPDVAPDAGLSEDDNSSSGGSDSGEDDYYPGDQGGCPPGGCYNPCPPGGCR
ncbi:hypothetical protein OG787_24640 [Streptomyces sp. NBC_00075]|uniref:hypothetical protein n=1 Tax=Streptomyces sp. NBC_00075 TaxID=2975641 RepID=UPI00324B6A12